MKAALDLFRALGSANTDCRQDGAAIGVGPREGWLFNSGIAGIERAVVSDMKVEWGEMYELLLVRRNAEWTNQIETLLEGSGTVFIAVGALHLAGDDSVQQILKARGVEVAPAP